MIHSYFRKLTGVALLAIIASGVQAAQDKTLTDEQWRERMQQHWQQVISEEDARKRRALLREHEELMEKATEAMGMDRRMGGHMGKNGHHDELMNRIDMHRHMMDMMR